MFCAASVALLWLDNLQRRKGRYGSWTLWCLTACCAVLLWLDIRLRGGEPASVVTTGGSLGIASGAVVVALLAASRAAGSAESPLIRRLQIGIAEHTAATLVLFLFCAPIFEESIYRGVLLTALWPLGAALAIAATLALYVALHLDSRLVVPLAVMGAAFTAATMLDGVIAAVIAHAVSNALAFAYGLLRRPPQLSARTRSSGGSNL